jgi:hypothetical protein
MYYRENAKSDSHSIKSSESLLGTALSLSRVFTSVEFEILTSSLKRPEIQPFTKGLLEAIDYRLRGSLFGGFLCLLAIESILKNLEYGHQELLHFASSLYRELDLSFSSELFSRLASGKEGLSHQRDSVNINSIYSLINHLEILQSNGLQTKDISRFLVSNKLFQRLPFRVKRSILKIITSLFQTFGRAKQFKFKWQ